MKFARSTKFRTGSAIFAVAIAMVSSTVSAQEAKPEADEEEAIVVTGSRIKVPGLVATSPIASVATQLR
jgi:hypothetical protein